MFGQKWFLGIFFYITCENVRILQLTQKKVFGSTKLLQIKVDMEQTLCVILQFSVWLNFIFEL